MDTCQPLHMQLQQLYSRVASGEMSWEDAAREEARLLRSGGAPKTIRRKIETRPKQNRAFWRRWRHKLPATLVMAFTDAQASALEALLYLVAQNGGTEAQVPVAAIAAAAQCSVRSVRLMLAQAQALGLIEREPVKLRAYRCAPNIYRVIAAPLRALCKAAKTCSVSKKETNISTSEAPSAGSRQAGRTAGGRTASGGAAPPSRPAEGDGAGGDSRCRRMGIAALRVLGVPVEGKNWTEAVEQLRRDRHPELSDGYWRWRCRALGPLAHLAVLAAALKTNTRRSIRCETAYLIGILRRPPEQCRPELSIIRLLRPRPRGGEPVEVE